MKNPRINVVITSNTVNEAPFNKVFDRISNAVLDSLLVENIDSKVAYETAVTTELLREMEAV
ncbi:MAG: S-adenosylmethionine synthetase [Desulforhopalus sp.]|jgi:S-adenosylmethionine synthetase